MENPGRNNRPYYPWEEQLLLSLKAHHFTWEEVCNEFNASVAENRQRTVPGLKHKYWSMVRAAEEDESSIPNIEGDSTNDSSIDGTFEAVDTSIEDPHVDAPSLDTSSIDAPSDSPSVYTPYIDAFDAEVFSADARPADMIFAEPLRPEALSSEYLPTQEQTLENNDDENEEYFNTEITDFYHELVMGAVAGNITDQRTLGWIHEQMGIDQTLPELD